MKRTIVFAICSLALLILFSACTDGVDRSSDSDGNINYESNSNTDDPSSDNGEKDMTPEISGITFYTINREVFLDFIQKPSCEMLQQKNEAVCTISKGGEVYTTYELHRFTITDEIVSFWGNAQKIGEFLEMESNVIPEFVVALDAPKVPLTLCVKYDIGTYFITVKANENGSGHEYVKYSHDAYLSECGRKSGNLIINGNTFNDAVRIYNGYADIPLTVVLKALGATVDRIDEKNASVIFDGKSYTMSLEGPSLCRTGQNYNLLYSVDGEAVFVYSQNKDIMLDGTTMRSVLHAMGYNANIACDDGNVTITPR